MTRRAHQRRLSPGFSCATRSGAPLRCAPGVSGGVCGALAGHLAAWEASRNAAGAKADWQFATADARVRLRKLYPTVDG